MNQDAALRQQLVNLLMIQQAHMSFEDAVANFPTAHINTRPPGLDYTFWHLIEHIRLCQWDILDYIHNSHYTAPSFPEGYWPARNSTTDAAGWEKTIEQFLHDRQALVDLIQNPSTDLYAPIPHGYGGHNILREILIVADHNAYHIGELGILRQTMGLWS
ncbi:MAG: DinB family protein [Anaerolineae bacterium]|nr:MAG: DinB family protein [Anaerolineae bacterium]